MSTSNNIEEIFSSNLSGFEASPDIASWSGLENQLNGQVLEDLFHSQLVNAKVDPSASSWKYIAMSLPTTGFLFYSLKTLNVYTLSGLAALITTIVLLTQYSTSEIINDPLIEPVQITENILSQETAYNIKEQSIAPMETNSTNNNLIEKENINSSFVGNITGDNAGNNVNNNQNQFSTPIVISDKNDSEATVDEGDDDKKKKKLVKKSKEKEPVHETQGSPVVEQKVEAIAQERQIYIDTLTVYDTIPVYDTLIVKKSMVKKAISSPWSFSPHASVFGSNPQYNSASIYSSETEINNQANSNYASYSLGLSANFDHKNWRVTSGIDYTLIQEEFDYKSVDLKTEPTTKYTLSKNGFYIDVIHRVSYENTPKFQERKDTISVDFTVRRIEHPDYTIIDTTWSYVIEDKLVKISDSTKVIHTDSVRVATYDTSYYNTIDTNVITTYYQKINRYSYIEIPLSIGYAFKINKFTIRPSVGAILSLMINSSGKGISNVNRNEVYDFDELDLPFMNFQVSMMFGVGFEYHIQDNLSLYIQPIYRKNLSSIYKKESIYDKKFSGFGASFGLTFYL